MDYLRRGELVAGIDRTTMIRWGRRGRVVVILAESALLGAGWLTRNDSGLSALCLSGLCLTGCWLLSSPRHCRISRHGLFLALSAAGLGFLAVLLPNGPAAGPEAIDASNWLGWFTAGVGTLRAVLLLPAVLIAVTVALALLGRALTPATNYSWLRPSVNVVPPATILGPDGSACPAAGCPLPEPARDLHRPPADLGLCVSGGGIRSASVTLGVLQVLNRRSLLARARYLVSVSGGGYTAGAFQLALNDPPAGEGWLSAVGETVTAPAELFREGSVEEDHIRRHGDYIADSGAEWLAALGAILRGAGASLSLLAGVVCWLGLLLGVFYRQARIVGFGYDYPFSPGASMHSPSFPPVPAGVWAAITIVTALAVLTWFVFIVVMTFAARAVTAIRLLASALLVVALGVLAVGVLIPLVLWAGVRLLWWANDVSSLSAAGLATGGAASSVALACLGALSTILWRSRKQIGGLRGRFAALGSLQQRVPRAWSQRLIVWSILTVIAAFYTLLLGAVVQAVVQADWNRSPGRWPWWPHWFLVAVCGAFLMITAVVDQTWMSLQPFYRRRVATAFAVRRIRTRAGVVAAPYRYDQETTTLSSYGAKREGFPQVIFSAAAALSGSDRTPPGRRAVSFSLSHDWVGGPQVGYVRTDALEENLGQHLKLDLTLQNAVAVSGAAFASAMGVQARAYQTLLALSNARLGTWLPNPGWLYRQDPSRDWTRPRLPRVRRVNYLLREVLGVFGQGNRLLLITDGGHYDNLGLVELLRHRCRTVICVDASGGAPPLAQGLAQAIGLAREELGIRIDLDEPFRMVPGSGRPLDPRDPLAPLSARLSESAFVTGTITYPEAFSVDGGPAGAIGRIIIVKSALTPQMPYELLAFAAENPAFPYDSTGDQWFDEGQFNAYHALGRYLGERAVEAFDALTRGIAEPEPEPEDRAVRVPGQVLDPAEHSDDSLSVRVS